MLPWIRFLSRARHLCMDLQVVYFVEMDLFRRLESRFHPLFDDIDSCGSLKVWAPLYYQCDIFDRASIEQYYQSH